MTKTPKFDNLDRARVIQEIERLFDVKLSQFGFRPKEQVDANGKLFWVLGGYGDWHGLPADMLERARSSATVGRIVIAKRLKAKMRIYIGSIGPFVAEVDKLIKTKKGDYHFDQEIRHGNLRVKQLPNAKFELLSEVDISDSDKVQDKRKSDLVRQYKSMSPEEKAEFMEALGIRNSEA